VGVTGVSRDYRNFFSTPNYPTNGQSYEIPILYAQLVSVGTKAHYNFGKSSRLLVRTLEIFQDTHILGASRGRLCDSSAFLLLLITWWGESGQVILQISVAFFRVLSKKFSGKDGSAPIRKYGSYA